MSNSIVYQFNPLEWPAGPIDTHNHDYNLGLRAHSSVQQHNIGRRHLTFDGRVYRYCLATTGGVDGYHGCNTTSGTALYEALATAQSIGDTEITMTQTGFTKDQLTGGYAFIYGASGGGSLHYIIGNDVSGTTTTRVKLLDPLHEAITTNYCEVFYNPYAACTMTATSDSSVVAVPACTAATTEYFWGQTWGPCVISPGETLTGGAKRSLAFGNNGAVFDETHAVDLQHAGFIMNQGTAYGPLVMLQISI